MKLSRGKVRAMILLLSVLLFLKVNNIHTFTAEKVEQRTIKVLAIGACYDLMQFFIKSFRT